MAHTYDLTEHLNDELMPRLDAMRNAVQFANREFEGMLKKRGDTVTVEYLPLISLTNATASTADIAATNITTTSYDIAVAQGKEVRIPVGSIDEVRAAFDIKGGLIDNLFTAVAQAHETHFLAQLATDAGNTVATAALAASTIQGIIEDMSMELTLDNVPYEGRKLFITPQVAKALRTSGYYVYTSEGYRKLRSAMAEDIAGFEVFVSTLLPTNTIVGFKAGVPNFIDQFTTFEVNKREGRSGYNVLAESYYQAKTVGELTKCIVKHVYS